MTAREMVDRIMVECRKAPTQTPRQRFSNAMGCLRSHAYDCRLLDAGDWPDEIDKPARWNMAAEIGNALGAFIEKAAVRLGALAQVHTNIESVYGTLDIEWGDYVLDLKWVGEYAWRKAKIAADPKHEAQTNGYSVARGKPKWALIYLPIHLLGKGEALEYIIHEGEADPARARAEITDRWASVAAHRAAGTLPDRELPQETCERLKCMHRKECWAND